MKAKKYRRCEHYMRNIYERGFGFRAPYQILLDASFCLSSLRHKFDAKERFTTVLGAASRLLVSACVMDELRRLARENPEDHIFTGAPFLARRMELRRCRHEPALSGTECIKSLLGEDNQFHYGVASDDEGLKEIVRRTAGVPLIYMERVFPLLETPGRVTLEALARKEQARLHVHPIEAAVIQKEFGPLAAEEPSKKYKKKKARGPNPLAVKKPTKSRAQPPNDAGTSKGSGRKRRKRRKEVSS